MEAIILLKQSGVHKQTKLMFTYSGSSGAPPAPDEAAPEPEAEPEAEPEIAEEPEAR